MGHARRRRRTAHVGGRHGLPHRPGHHRGPATPRGARRVRLHPRARCLLRGGDRVVCPAARVELRPRVDYLHQRRGARRVGHHQGDDPPGRHGHRADARLQLLLLVHTQQRLPARLEPAAGGRGTVHRRLRGAGTPRRRPARHGAAAMQPAQPHRAGVDAGRAAPHRRHLPAARRIRHRRRDRARWWRARASNRRRAHGACPLPPPHRRL